MHLILPPKILHNLCFSSSWVLQLSQETVLMQILGANKVHCGKCGSGVEHETRFFTLHPPFASPITRLVCAPPLPNFSITLTLYLPWVLQSHEKLKTTYAKQGLLWKMWKWRNLSFSFFTFTLFKKRANLRRIYKIFITLTLTLIKTGWKKRHVDNCGCYENDIFCEIGQFGEDSSKVWGKNYMRQQKRPIGSWRFSPKL